MSATGSELVEAPPSTPQVEALLRDCVALTDALGRARRVRQVLMLATVALVAVACWLFYSLGRRLQSPENLDEVRRLAEARLSENSGRYMGEVQLLVDRTSPVLTDAFYKQAKKDLPAFLHAAGGQRDAFVKEMQAKLAGRLDEHYGRALDRHKALLEAEFPAIKDEELRRRMMANLQAACEKLVRKYYVDELRGQTLALYDGWDRFPQSEPSAKDGPPLEDQFIASMLELLTLKLTESREAARR